MSGARTIGVGAFLPPGEISNRELARHLGVDESWIEERTGIRSRRTGGTTADAATAAAALALEMAGLRGEDVDVVILATTSPDLTMPPTVARVAEALDISGGSSDLNAACSGFVYGLVQAHGLIRLGLHRILLIGAETMRRVTDPDDRDTSILFGDGAGAVVIEAHQDDELLAFDLGGDPTARRLLQAPLGGYMEMDGREIFRRAVRAIVSSAEATLDRAGLSIDDLDLVVPHQANIRIIEAACNRLGVPMTKVATVLDHTGNTSSASIPLALAAAVDQERVAEGATILLVGFGAGMSWGSALLRWGGATRSSA